MIDSQGNWYPVLPDNPTATTGYGELLWGPGVPGVTVGNNGDVWVRTSDGAIYTKFGNVWSLNTGGSGAVQVIAGAGADPNVALIALDDPSKGGFYTQDGAGLTNMWRWDVTAQTWIQITG